MKANPSRSNPDSANHSIAQNSHNVKANADSDSRKDENTMKTTNNGFNDLLRQYEQATRTRTADTETVYTKTLTDLAKAVAYSVLKKCIDVSQNKQLSALRRDIARDVASLEYIAYASENAYETVLNADGEGERKVKDNDSVKALSELTTSPLGDGLDLVNDAVCAILEQTAKSTLAGEFMETPYTVRRLNKKVWIKTADSVNGWETVETTAIQEVFKAVRRAIDSSRAMQTDPRNGYTYLQELATDNDSGTEDTIYRRLAKYADLGGYVTDFNGACTLYTVDKETVKDVDEIVGTMNLTRREATILQLRLSGYGKKAIATYLGISVSSVATLLRRIQKKAGEIGLMPIE